MKQITVKDIVTFIQNNPCLETIDGTYYSVGYSKEKGLCYATENCSDFTAIADLDTSDKEWYPEPTGEENMDYFYNAEVEENPAFMECVKSIYKSVSEYIRREEND